MDLDEGRWRRLLDNYRDAQDDAVPFLQVQQAGARRAAARSALETYKARVPKDGQVNARHSYEDLSRMHAAGVRELEQRLVEADREVARIEARSRDAAKHRASLQRTIEGVRAWAAAQQPPVILPGDRPEQPAVIRLQPPPADARPFGWGAA